MTDERVYVGVCAICRCSRPGVRVWRGKGRNNKGEARACVVVPIAIQYSPLVYPPAPICKMASGRQDHRPLAARLPTRVQINLTFVVIP